MNISASNEKRLGIQQSNNACISVGLNILIASGGEKKHQSPVMKLMGSIGAGKLYLIISLTLSCWQLQNTQWLPLLLGCSLSMTYLWPREDFYYLSIIDLSVQTIILLAQWCLELRREAGGGETSRGTKVHLCFPITTSAGLVYICGTLEWLEAPTTLEAMHSSFCGDCSNISWIRGWLFL